MLGLSSLAQKLAASANDEVLLWLESGLRTALDASTSEGIELAFKPLLLSRSAPPLQQFHAAVEALPGDLQARIRWACGALLGSLRAQDDVRYVACLWSVAIALKPPGGVVAAARQFLQQVGRAPNVRKEYRRVVDYIMTAALSYPRSSELDALVYDIRAFDLWTRRHAEQFVVFLVAAQPSEWPRILRSFQDEIAPIHSQSSGFVRRLIKAIGPDELGRAIYLLNEADGLDWLWPAVEANAMMQLRGDCLYVEFTGSSASIPQEAFPAETTDAQTLAIFRAVDFKDRSDEADAEARLLSSLNSPRVLQVLSRVPA